MVAIVTGGNGGRLGLEQSSAMVLGGKGQLGSAGLGRADENVYVNAASGNLVVSNSDEVLIGRGPDDVISRTYNSLGDLSDDNGDNWRMSFQRKVAGLTGTVNSAPSTITRTDWDGSQVIYTYQSSGTYSGKYVAYEGAGSFDTLTYASNVWTWTDGSSRVVESYDATNSGRITASADVDGNVLSFTYNGSGLVSRVTTASGDYTDMVYSGTLLTQVETRNSSGTLLLTRTRYTYDGFNRLSTVTVDLTPANSSISDNVKYVTTYGYDSSNRVTSITQTDGSSLAVTYDSSSRVTSLVQTSAASVNRTTMIAYTSSTVTTITDPDGQVTTLEYDGAGQLTKITQPPAVSGGTAQVRQFTYSSSSGNVLSVSDGPNNVVNYQYTTGGNCSLAYDSAGNVTAWTYGSNNEILSKTVYRTATSNPSLPGLASDPATTRYVYDSENHLRYVITPEGTVTRHTYTSYGQVATTTQFLGDFYTTSGTPSESTMNSWVSGLSDKSDILLTYNSYTYRGAIDAIQVYSKSTSGGAADTSSTVTTTYHTYDQAGNLLTRWTQGAYYWLVNNTETYTYDGLGRVLTASGATSVTTSYNDAASTTTVTLANGLSQVSTYNLAGDLISYAESGSGVTTATSTYKYDTNGRVRVAADALGNKTYLLYDRVGRQVAQVSSLGTLTEFKYDANDRLAARVTYATLLSSGTLSGLEESGVVAFDAVSGIVPTANAADQWVWNVYDDAGRLTGTIDGTGAVITHEYNGVSQLVKSTAYANLLSSGTVTGYKATAPTSLTIPTADSANDRVTRLFYDTDGRNIGALDATGALSEVVYDGAGQVMETIAYATATNSSNRASGSWATLRSDVTGTTNPADVHNWMLYDGRGLLYATIDGEGDLVRYDYDWKVDLTQTTAGQQLSVATLLSTRPTLAGLPSASSDTVLARSEYAYDAYHRVLTTGVDVGDLRLYSDAGYTTELEFARMVSTAETAVVYDSMGNVVQVTDALDAKTIYWYDLRGRRVAEVNPLGALHTFAYDVDGNLTAARAYDTLIGWMDLITLDPTDAVPTGSGTYRETTYAYDAENRLTTATVASVLTGEYTSSWATTTSSVSTTTYYDAFGRAVKTTDARGNSAYALYDVRNQLVATADQEKFLNYTAYNAFGQATKTEAFSTAVSSVSETSDAATLRSGVSSGSGNRVTNYTYDKAGRVLTTSRESVVQTAVSSVGAPTVTTAASTSTLEYDVLGRVSRATEATGDYTDFTYDRAGHLTASIGPAFTDYTGASVRTGVYNTYNGLGLVTSTTVRSSGGTSANDRTTTYEYIHGGRLRTVTDAEGAETFLFYDLLGNTIVTAYYRGSVGEARIVTYDAIGQVTKESFGFAEANDIEATYMDEEGTHALYYQIYEWDESGDYTNYSYNAHGELTAKGVNGGSQEVWAFDNAGRLWKTNAGDGTWKIYVHDKSGNVSLTVESAGQQLGGSGTYADLTSVSQSSAAAAGSSAVSGMVATINVHDKRGQTTQVRELNRELSASSTNNLITHDQTYNAFGEVATSRNANGANADFDTILTYNTLGKLIKKEMPKVAWTSESGSVTTGVRPTEEYFYDVAGRMVGMQDANAHVGTAYYSTWKLDGAGRIIKEFHADGGVAETKFDVYGNARKKVDELGKMETLNYDKLNRLTIYEHVTRTSASPGNPGSALTLIEYFSYDSLGQLTAKWNSQFGSSYKETTTYDLQGRVTQTKDLDGRETNFSYSWNGSLATTGMGTFGGWTRTTTTPIQTGASTYRTHVESTDIFGRLVEETDLGGHTYDYTYDKAGQLILKDYFWGIELSTAYFNTGQVARVDDTSYSTITASTNFRTIFGYDAAGNRTTEKRVGDQGTNNIVVKDVIATYDALGRVVSYDDTGVVESLSTDYEYDLNGNVRRYQKGSQNNWSKYDRMNREVLKGGTLASGVITRGVDGESYSFDYAGRMVTQTTSKDKTSWIKDTTETYSYSDDGIVAKLDWIGETADNTWTSSATRWTKTLDALGRTTEHVEGGSTRTYTYTKTGLTLTDEVIVGSEHVKLTNTYADSSGYWQGVVMTAVTTRWIGSATPASDRSITYTYDWGSGPRQATQTTVDSSGTKTYVFTYDAAGYLAKLLINGVTEMRYLYDTGGKLIKDFRFNYAPVYDNSSLQAVLDATNESENEVNHYKDGKLVCCGETVDFANDSGEIWIVQVGDTLSSIAAYKLGSSAQWVEIADLNGIEAYRALTPGEELKIPVDPYAGSDPFALLSASFGTDEGTASQFVWENGSPVGLKSDLMRTESFASAICGLPIRDGWKDAEGYWNMGRQVAEASALTEDGGTPVGDSTGAAAGITYGEMSLSLEADVEPSGGVGEMRGLFGTGNMVFENLSDMYWSMSPGFDNSGGRALSASMVNAMQNASDAAFAADFAEDETCQLSLQFSDTPTILDPLEVVAHLPTESPAPTAPTEPEGPGFWGRVGTFFRNFGEGLIAGDFSDNDSFGAIFGKIVGGLLPFGDIRDTAAAVINFAKNPGWGTFGGIGIAAVGYIPLLGDGVKVLAKYGDDFLGVAGGLGRSGDQLLPLPATASGADFSVGSGGVAAEGVPLNTRVALQGVTDRAVADLAANPSLARDLMSPGSYRQLVEGTNLAPATYGKAVERLSGRYVQADPELSQILSYQSRPFASTPDFFGFEGYNLRTLDITTEAGRASHLARPYGAYTDYVTHPGLPPSLVFPR